MRIYELELAAILDNELQHYKGYILADADIELLHDGRIKLITTSGRVFWITITEEDGE